MCVVRLPFLPKATPGAVLPHVTHLAEAAVAVRARVVVAPLLVHDARRAHVDVAALRRREGVEAVREDVAALPMPVLQHCDL